jgi:hypothetical protein
LSTTTGYWLVLALVPACAGTELGSLIARQHVTDAAASDYACPKARVTVEKEDTDTWSYDLLVCGVHRRYKDIAGKSGWRFVEVDGGVAPGVGGPALSGTK